MDAVQKTVVTSAEIADEQRRQILQVAQEVVSESKSTSPNLVRVRGALIGVATAVQTLGSARDAYELIKSAATLLGIRLP